MLNLTADNEVDKNHSMLDKKQQKDIVTVGDNNTGDVLGITNHYD